MAKNLECDSSKFDKADQLGKMCSTGKSGREVNKDLKRGQETKQGEETL